MIRLRFDRTAMPPNATDLKLIDKMREIVTYQTYNSPGFFHGFVSSLKSFPLWALQKEYLELGNRGKSILVIWVSLREKKRWMGETTYEADTCNPYGAQGTADDVNPFDHAQRLLRLMPQ